MGIEIQHIFLNSQKNPITTIIKDNNCKEPFIEEIHLDTDEDIIKVFFGVYIV